MRRQKPYGPRQLLQITPLISTNLATPTIIQTSAHSCSMFNNSSSTNNFTCCDYLVHNFCLSLKTWDRGLSELIWCVNWAVSLSMYTHYTQLFYTCNIIVSIINSIYLLYIYFADSSTYCIYCVMLISLLLYYSDII